MPQVVVLSREMTICLAPTATAERIEEMASDILSSAPARFALAGQGFGGVIAMELLRRAPERITRLALIASTPLADTPQESADREARIVAAKAGRLDDVIKEELPLTALFNGAVRAEVFAKVAAMGRANGAAAYIRQARALQRRKDQQATLRKTKQPALVICGENDTLIPVKRHEFVAELMPHAHLQIVPDAGHVPTLENPGAVTEILRAWMKQPLVLR